MILWKNSEQSDRGYFYLMDLNSTHGSVLNKNQVSPGTAVKIPIGNNVIKFGGSTRSFMLNSVVAEPVEVESVEVDSAVETKDSGCSWGVREDACDEDGNEEGEEAFLEKFTTLLNTPQNEPSPNENAFADNPQKILQIWFDQEGYDFEYQVGPEGSNFKATIQLPIEGRDVPIEGPSQSKKRDAITQLCLKVCKLLDRAERLFPWQHQNNRKRNKDKIEEEDEEDLYDETEQSKAKKAKKLIDQKLKEKQVGAETYESLKIKYDDWSEERTKLEERLKSIGQPQIKCPNEGSELDPLDEFMNNQIEDPSKRMDVKIEKSKLKMKIKELEKKLLHCEKLMVIARPTHIPLFNAQPRERIDEVTVVKPLSKSVDLGQESSKEPTFENVVDTSSKATKFQMKIAPKSLPSSKAFKEEPSEPTKNENKKRVATNIGLGVGASLKEMKQQALDASESHEDFIDWVPPKNQDGSGKTSLNQKFGY